MSEKNNENEEIKQEVKEAEKETEKEVSEKEVSKKEVSETSNTAEEESVTFDADGNVIVKKKRKKRRQRKASEVNIVKELVSLIIYFGIVILVCFLIITFVGCRSKVDGNSMNPTLNDRDSVWVNKLAYRIGDPKRFDVIIFNYDEDTTYVKRIIGLPGETVMIDQEGNIYIDGEILQENYGKERIFASNLGRASSPVILGHDEYFVLGDNRNGSSDSRWADVGNVNRSQIVGKAVFRIFPLNAIGPVK